MTDSKKAALIILVILAILIGMFACPLVMSIPFQVSKCNLMEQNDQNHQYEWLLFGGCMVQTDTGYWVNINDIPFSELGINAIITE